MSNMQDHIIPIRDAARYPAKWQANGAFIGHEISVQCRLPARLGGVDNGKIISFKCINDTGATIGSICRSDWDSLNVLGVPVGEHIPTFVADGTMQLRETATYEMRLVQLAADGVSIFAISDWMEDRSIIMDDPEPGQENPLLRLSGDAMRHHLYFLTSPKHSDWLYVARTKEAMIEVLTSL